MRASLDISPVGLGPCHSFLNNKDEMAYSEAIDEVQFVTGPSPIPALACSDAPELGLPSSHSYGYDSQSSPAFRRICPASSLGMLVKYSG